ncbi:MAG: hypothetical protein DYG88_05985 [Chloroflexi bacterium CFX4]|nr:hypothetical protein [Chloroflexi bacterium CFX4]MDL1922838.1 RDD family protein [Chloroflexi bacterium CFX3]
MAVNLGVSILYYAYLLTAQAGQTPGKAALNIRIIKLNGKPLTVWDSIVRSQIGFLWILRDEQRQGWYDKRAGTLVIKAR